MSDRRQNSDHDLLIELRTEMQGVRRDIKELTDGTAGKLSDHETRLRFIEKYVWGAIAIIGFINLIGISGFVYLLTHIR
jgi:hypothetical protein